jgi:hypothetical protein
MPRPRTATQLKFDEDRRQAAYEEAGEWKEIFLRSLAIVPVIKVACMEAKISRKSAYKWREKDAQFKADWDDAREQGIDVLEANLFNRGVKTDTTAAIFLLKNLRPDVYRDRYEHSGPGGGPMQLEVTAVAEVFRHRITHLAAVRRTPELTA